MSTANRGIEQNREYDPFASIYNRHWGGEYRAQALPIVDRLLLSELGTGSSVLDVCCGTGQFAREVQNRGFEVTGIDASEEMIRYANENAPMVAFSAADVRSFDLGRRFEAAYSVFESLNHVPDMNGLEDAFHSVRRHLVPGGTFLFDLNREDAFVVYWNNTDAIVEGDHVCVMRSDFDEHRQIGTCQFTVFELDEEHVPRIWRRRDFTVCQTCHDLDAVYGALLQAGFEDIRLYDSRDLGMAGDIGYARTFFLATNPG